MVPPSFWGEGSPTKNRLQKKRVPDEVEGVLRLTSEDGEGGGGVQEGGGLR